MHRRSTAIAFRNVIRSGGGCSSIQEKAVGETGRSRNMEPWFSQRKSTVGELPEDTNESLWEDIIPPGKRRCLRKFGRGLRWFCPYRPYPFISKVSTVAFSMAQLLER